jgi:adenosylmethionine-8-amino-7-oxononanoate aminotransferase
MNLARQYWTSFADDRSGVDIAVDPIVDARGSTVQLGNGFLYLDAAADAAHCLFGYERPETANATAVALAAQLEKIADGYRCVAFTDSMNSAVNIAQGIAGNGVEVVNALFGEPSADDGTCIAVENRSLGRAATWFASSLWKQAPMMIVIGEALTAGTPFAALLAASEVKAPPFVNTADADSLARAAGAIAAVERGDMMSGVEWLGRYFQVRTESLIETDGEHLAIETWPLAARISFKEKSAPQMKRKLCERGVLVGLDAANNAITVVPPLIMRPAEIDVITGTLRGALHDIPTWRPSACCNACQTIGPAF